VRNPAPTHEPKRKSNRTVGVSTYIGHAVASSSTFAATRPAALKSRNNLS
jgi:hypothetical protein